MNKLETIKNARGFLHANFRDRYDTPCSIQKSSLATEDCIWLGVSDPQPVIMASDALRLGLPNHGETTGWVPYHIPPEVCISTRMHLDQEMVADLIPVLQYFVDTGELPSGTIE